MGLEPVPDGPEAGRVEEVELLLGAHQPLREKRLEERVVRVGVPIFQGGVVPDIGIGSTLKCEKYK